MPKTTISWTDCSWPVVSGETRLWGPALDLPVYLQRPSKIFVCDMGDLFAEGVPDAWIDAVFGVMHTAQQHIYQVLTKRPQRMARYMQQHYDHGCGPPPFIWCGVSVEDQQTAEERIPWLIETPARIRFVCVEPLLSEVDLTKIRHDHYMAGETVDVLGSIYDGDECIGVSCEPEIHWVIIGGESGSAARPCYLSWVRSLIAQCYAVDVACWVKGSNVAEWPADMRVQQFPK